MSVTLTAFIEQVANGTMMGAIYVLVALGLVLIFGVMEVLNFAHGVIFMAGGYVCDVFFMHVIGSYPLAVVAHDAHARDRRRRARSAPFSVAFACNMPMQIVASLGLILMAENAAVLHFRAERAAVDRALASAAWCASAN